MNINLNLDILQCVIIAMGYITTNATSGLIVRHFISGTKQKAPIEDSRETLSNTNYDTGAIIGKCENFLTITLILASAFTGLALIFTAKSIVRSEDIKKDPKYYLGGTLVNFSYSVFMGFFIRFCLNTVGHPL